jgi:hypothetical protein
VPRFLNVLSGPMFAILPRSFLARPYSFSGVLAIHFRGAVVRRFRCSHLIFNELRRGLLSLASTKDILAPF